jgi:7-keto-8-aminopelargonate synthetase-like enzyme
MREPEALQQVDRTYVRFRGRKLCYFSGCDYFRLASHPEVVSALVQGVKKYGLNVAASRLTTGNHLLYRQLEQRLAEFFGAPAALLISSGYMTDIAVTQTLAGNFSHALIDAESHPAVSDAARFLDCPVLQFKHRSAEDLTRTVRRCGAGARLLLLTEGLFARDGGVAPLAEYMRRLPKDAWLLVDDAHGGGVLGHTGRGSLEFAGVSRARIIQTITLSKAFGAYGGAILGNADLRRKIINKSRLFVGSTPLPLPLASAALRSIEILKSDRLLRKRLEANVSYVRKRLANSRVALGEVPGPIIVVIPPDARQASQLKIKLLQAGIWPSFIRYPTGPDSGYFRFVISSEHTCDQLNALIDVLAAHS